ncbi:TnsD family Tn7-like transposition protein [Bacillus cereus]|uniref:TnsD family Tn7-like transposition protein n=1 Tax=Bacillus cereus TaxID=1396 RepID=UPI001F30D4EA|nr:TnsD family Tn7-like transposition protein [Bacillus cereus]BCC29294.1 hypothetical protein BCM0100_2020 [Bacillus cereus]
MFTYFPGMYEGEALYSVFARYHVRSGHLNTASTMQALFGTKGLHKNISIELPTALYLVYQKAAYFNVEPIKEWIYKHTFYPYYVVFTNKDIQRKVYQLMINGTKSSISVMSITGSGSSYVKPPNFLRYCPKCFKEDMNSYGESYWRVVHQLPSVFICPKHEIPLHSSRLPYKGTSRVKYVTASLEVCNGDPVIFGINNNLYQNLLNLAKQSDAILESRVFYDRIDLHKKYKILMEQRGYVTKQGNYHQKLLREDMLNFYSQQGLSLLQSPLPDQTDTWLKFMLTKKNYSSHPVRHLLLLQFLGQEICDMKRELELEKPFGAGPFPCLNKAAIHYGDSIINNVELEYCNRRKSIIGVFRCQCGFIYTRLSEGDNKNNLYKYNNVREYGNDWRKKVLEERANFKTFEEIGSKLGVHRVTISAHLKSYELEEGKEQNKKCLIQERMKAFKQLMKQYPNDSITQLRGRNAALYDWLKVHNKEWLYAHRPVRQEPKRIKKKKILWGEKDREILDKLRKEVELLISQEKPIRITRTKLGKSLGCNHVIKNKLDKLPNSKLYLEKVVETVEEFQIRRINWAASQIYKEGNLISVYQIRLKAGFLNPKRMSKRIWQEIYNQANLYKNKGL